jgi:hypothetical protein
MNHQLCIVQKATTYAVRRRSNGNQVSLTKLCWGPGYPGYPPPEKHYETNILHWNSTYPHNENQTATFFFRYYKIIYVFSLILGIGNPTTI